jgi:sugar/nucleoside kinase (ribokinase family)
VSSSSAARPAPLILCAGITVLDHVYRMERFPAPGTKTRARDFLVVIGGCAANAAVAIARLGGSARLAAPLGGPRGIDAVGDAIVAGVEREGIDTAGIERLSGVISPTSAIIIDATGERLIVNQRDEALTAVRAADPEQAVANVDAMLADNRYSEFVLPIAAAARRRGISVVLDGDRPTRASDALLSTATHVIFAADGLRATAGVHGFGEALRRISRHTGAFLAVTDGERGAWWLDGDALRHQPAFAVDAVDTLAAGDVFHGAFALALAEGHGEPAAMRFAAAAAALKCTRFGGGSAAPKRDEVDELLGAT